MSWISAPPRIVAHRGAADEAPENTLAAFRRAIEVGAPAIELDVHLTRDGELVVIHDETLERTTNGTGLVVDATLAEIRPLDAGSWFAARFSHERVPTLKEVLALAKGRTLVNVEVKAWSDDAARIVEAVAEVVRGAKAERSVFLSSFVPAVLERSAVALPEVPRGFITMAPPDEDDLEWTRRFASAVGIYWESATPEAVRALTEARIATYAWTVNDETVARDLFAAGVTGIITDAPAKLLRLGEPSLPPSAGL